MPQLPGNYREMALGMLQDGNPAIRVHGATHRSSRRRFNETGRVQNRRPLFLMQEVDICITNGVLLLSSHRKFTKFVNEAFVSFEKVFDFMYAKYLNYVYVPMRWGKCAKPNTDYVE